MVKNNKKVKELMTYMDNNNLKQIHLYDNKFYGFYIYRSDYGIDVRKVDLSCGVSNFKNIMDYTAKERNNLLSSLEY